jgi:glycosyltransferase involved in cell wall biosynthesis
MKIIYLPGYRYPNDLDEPLTSGDLRYSFTLSRALARLGHSVHVITRRDPGDLLESELDGVKIHRYKSELSKIFGTSYDISPSRYKLFKKLQKDADLIICNSALSLEHLTKISAPIIYIASGLEDVKNYSFSPQEVAGFLAIKLLRDPMKRLTWKKSRLVNTTAWHEDKTLLDWGVPKSKIGTISSGIDTERFHPRVKEAEALRLKLKLKKDTKVILSVSRFTPAKGIIETIDGFNKLDQSGVKLIIVGVHHSHDTTYYSKIVNAINVSKHKKDIILIENVPEQQLPVYYSLADVTSVFSKGYDPLPTTIIESMACGTPVASTYYKTREQFIEDNKTGLFIKERDIDDWVEKISKILDNSALRNKLAKSGLDYVKDNFDSVEIAKKYIKELR